MCSQDSPCSTNTRLRTRSRAGSCIAEIPPVLTTITDPGYDHAFACGDSHDSRAYLQETRAGEIRLSNGGQLEVDGQTTDMIFLSRIMCGGGTGTAQLTAEDTLLLELIFSVLKRQADSGGSSRNVRIYVPDLMRAMGYRNPAHADRVAGVAEKIRRYRSVLGIIDHVDSRCWPLLDVCEFDPLSNALDMGSPYMEALLGILTAPAGGQNSSEGERRGRKAAKPAAKPKFVSAIRTELCGQRARRAAAIVREIVLLVVRAGARGLPHIRVGTLIRRVPELADYVLDPAVPVSDRNRILKRTFSAAWDYLPAYTLLQERYTGLAVPSFIPTLRDMDHLLEFPHGGLSGRSRTPA